MHRFVATRRDWTGALYLQSVNELIHLLLPETFHFTYKANNTLLNLLVLTRAVRLDVATNSRCRVFTMCHVLFYLSLPIL